MRSRIHIGIAATTGAAWTVVLCASASAQLLFEFNSASELSGNFVEANFGAGPNFTFSSSPGVGGVPGRIQYLSSASLYYKQAADPSSMTLQLGVYFQYNQYSYDPGRRNDSLVELGWSDSSLNPMYPGVATARYMTVSLAVGTNGGLERRLVGQLVDRPATNFVFSTPSGTTNFPLPSGIYELVGTWNLSGTNRFDLDAALFSHGPDGTGPAVELAAFSAFVDDPVLAASHSLFGGIDRPFDVSWLDNISVVPEPGPLPLLFLGLGLALCGLRLRQEHNLSWIFAELRPTQSFRLRLAAADKLAGQVGAMWRRRQSKRRRVPQSGCGKPADSRSATQPTESRATGKIVV